MEWVLLHLYSALAGLYPQEFRRDFGAEMQAVFSQALGDARREGLAAVIRLSSRELRELPGALVREHWEAIREEPEMRDDIRVESNPRDPVEDPGDKSPAASWWEVFLAVLPFLLILLLEGVPMLLVESGLFNWEDMRTGSAIFSGVVLLGAFIAAWRRGWPIWSGTWSLIFLFAPLGLASWLASLLFEQDFYRGLNLQSVFLFQVVPLAIAVLLYVLTRLDRLRGILAALPVLYLLWLPNMEFVPDLIEVSIEAASTALICLAIALILRRLDWRLALFAVLGVNLVVGLMFSYAGIFHGGSLPFSAPGPNLVEVLRSMVPQYLATCAILLGPLFAWRIRQAGRAGSRVGTSGYHLALAGLFLVIVANLASLMTGIDSASTRYKPIFGPDVLMAEIVLGLALYALGIYMVYGNARFTREDPRWLQLILLAFLPLVIPFALISPFVTSWGRPVSSLYGVPLLWELPQVISFSLGLVWLLLSVWLVTRGPVFPDSSAPMIEPVEAPQVSKAET